VYRNIKRRIITLENLPDISRRAQRTRSRVVYTEGFWDLFHDEHAEFLANCAKLGDWLVAGVVRDDMMQPLKQRDTVISEERRLYIVAAHVCVDWAVLIRSPEDVIPALKPHVIAISPTSIPERNQQKYKLAETIGGEIIVVGSRNTIHSSQIARRLAQGAERVA
jgi:cytidyltransferase-like protein